MEFTKSFNIGTDYKDRFHQPSWEMRQFADVLFIDKTHSTPPRVYVLSDSKVHLNEILNLYKTFPVNFSDEAFVLVGECLLIDKKGKQVFLANKNVVAYQHLVIVSGKKATISLHSNELVSALQALTDALRVKPKIPDSFPKQPHAHSQRKKRVPFATKDKPVSNHDQQSVEKIVHPYIVDTAHPSPPNHLNAHHSRFYEVQI